MRRLVLLEDTAKALESSRDCATTKLIRNPVELLRADGEINITFPDSGGAIASVARVTAMGRL